MVLLDGTVCVRVCFEQLDVQMDLCIYSGLWGCEEGKEDGQRPGKNNRDSDGSRWRS